MQQKVLLAITKEDWAAELPILSVPTGLPGTDTILCYLVAMELKLACSMQSNPIR